MDEQNQFQFRGFWNVGAGAVWQSLGSELDRFHAMMLKSFTKKPPFDIDRIKEIEESTRHDVVCFHQGLYLKPLVREKKWGSITG